MSFLYVTEQGAHIKKSGGHIKVVKDAEVLADRVIEELETLVCFGGVHPTTDALLALVNKGCDIAFMTLNGHFKGRMVSATGKNSLLRVCQHEAFRHPARKLALASRYVQAKIRNGIVVLEAYGRNGHSPFEFDEKQQLERICGRVEMGVDSPASLRGHEGTAARVYFGGFSRCLAHGRQFPGRIFRPSTDPVNALLSFGYSFVAREMQAMCEAAGLDPYIGFFHDISYGRASLSLDLMEEFRHPLVDRLVLRLFNKRVLDDDDFERGDKGQVYLKKESLRIFVRHYEEWANSANRTYGNERELSWRKAMWSQVEKLKKAVENGTEYYPFSWDPQTAAAPEGVQPQSAKGETA